MAPVNSLSQGKEALVAISSPSNSHLFGIYFEEDYSKSMRKKVRSSSSMKTSSFPIPGMRFDLSENSDQMLMPRKY
jgi:hypothetical protein